MKLLVLAQTPPPVHGQSIMVQTLLDGLPAHGIALHHVNLRLSQDAADIGRWRIGKVFALLGACARAVTARLRHGCDTLYYVPAPGKRVSLYRDWAVMLLCRPFFARLVLHWHAAGLADWLHTSATPLERAITRWLLGRADLSLVLAESLRPDAQTLAAKRIAIVRNGIADPGGPGPRALDSTRPWQVLFLGLCSEDKGLFDAAQAVLEANRQVPPGAGGPSYTLVAAGAFADPETAQRFHELAAAHPAVLRHAGFAEGAAKDVLLRQSCCLCLPTHYPHEGQPLVLLEAMACDLPILTTRWRGIAEILPAQHVYLVEPGRPEQIAQQLHALRAAAPPAGLLRRHFLAHFTMAHHLTAIKDALLSLRD